MARHWYHAPEWKEKPESEIDWHGWGTAPNEALYIGRAPGRKGMCLYARHGTVRYALAFFPSVEQAEETMHILDRIVLWRTPE